MHMRHRLSLFLLPLAVAAAQAAPSHRAPGHAEYRVSIVGPVNSAPTDINGAGVVVGTYPTGSGAIHGFLNRGRGLVDLGTLGGTSSSAVAINDKGQVLGNWTTAAGQQRGFIYYRGTQRDIGVIPGRSTTFTDINNAGYITAIGGPPDFSAGPRSFLRTPDGRYIDIGNLPFPNPITRAQALNNRNQITGESGPFLLPDIPYHGFLWTRGTMRDIGTLGYEPVGGQDINDRGQIAGYAALPEGFRDQVAVLYSNGRLINLDGRPATEDRYSTGDGINNHGHVVGFSNHLSGYVHRGRRMQSLNALIDPRLGWDIRFPRAINDAGQIAAIAYRNGVQYAVRLDLVKPHHLAAPEIAPDDEAAPPATAAAEARADAEAQAREVAHPLAQ